MRASGRLLKLQGRARCAASMRGCGCARLPASLGASPLAGAARDLALTGATAPLERIIEGREEGLRARRRRAWRYVAVVGSLLEVLLGLQRQRILLRLRLLRRRRRLVVPEKVLPICCGRDGRQEGTPTGEAGAAAAVANRRRGSISGCIRCTVRGTGCARGGGKQRCTCWLRMCRLQLSLRLLLLLLLCLRLSCLQGIVSIPRASWGRQCRCQTVGKHGWRARGHCMRS